MSSTIGSRIKEKRKGLNLTQGDLAKLIGSYAGDISDWERNKTRPSADKLRKLAIHLKSTTDYLIQGKIETEEIKEGKGTYKMDCVSKLEAIMKSPYIQKNEKAELLGYIQMYYEKLKEESEKDSARKIHALPKTMKNG